MKQQQKTRRNYLLLGASLLLVGLAVQILREHILTLNTNVFLKTLLIMFMIAAGYSFAESIIAPFANGVLNILQKPFVSIAGQKAGPVIFYLVVYGLLFTAYLFVFVYGMKMPLF